jgi:hypothetical protein
VCSSSGEVCKSSLSRFTCKVVLNYRLFCVIGFDVATDLHTTLNADYVSCDSGISSGTVHSVVNFCCIYVSLKFSNFNPGCEAFQYVY